MDPGRTPVSCYRLLSHWRTSEMEAGRSIWVLPFSSPQRMCYTSTCAPAFVVLPRNLVRTWHFPHRKQVGDLHRSVVVRFSCYSRFF